MKPEKGKYYMWINDNGKASTLNLYIYDYISSDGYGDSVNATQVINRLANYDGDDINVYINSDGGEVYEAYGIATQLLRSGKNVTCYIDGRAASAATLIPMVAKKVIMQSYANMYLHNMWIIAQGNSDDLRRKADDLDKLMEANRQLYMRRYNGTEEELAEMLDKGTTLTAKDCVEKGLADEIVDQIDDHYEEQPKPEPETDMSKVAQTITDKVMGAVNAKLEQMLKAEPEPKQEPKPEPENNFMNNFLKED